MVRFMVVLPRTTTITSLIGKKAQEAKDEHKNSKSGK
jgi:hypothetical protein